MPKIRTVLGDIDRAKLGHCQTHEHVLCDESLATRPELTSSTRSAGKPGESMGDLPKAMTRMILDDEERALELLEAYRAAGGGAIAEMTTDGWGRDPQGLARLSEKSGVHIIMSTGFYTEPYIPRFAYQRSIADLAELMVAEIESGVGGSGVCAGVIKSAIYAGRIEGIELKCLRAVALAQRETGAPVTSHTTGSRRSEVPGGSLALDHLEVLEEEGANPERFIAGHTDAVGVDIEHLSMVAGRGAYVQFDLLGKLGGIEDVTRVDLILELFDRGFGDRILLGTDRCRRPELYPELGGEGYNYVLNSFVDQLRHRGLGEEEIRMMTLNNPARILAF
ncbi:MAG: hypothetical protein R6U92_02015 [Bacillota bacterium]